MASPANRSRFIKPVAWSLAALGVLLAVTLGPLVVRELRARLSSATVADRMSELTPRIEPRWRERLGAAGLTELPRTLVIVGLKAERELMVFAPAASGGYRKLATYPIVAASGGPGPKLKSGDRQVPEGIYGVESLNPNSRFHLALRVGYPSAEDRSIAAAEDRTDLGGDIMIHGGAGSVGCIALGDPAIEEVFWLVASVGPGNVEVVLAPSTDPASRISTAGPAWLADRYAALAAKLRSLGIAGGQTERVASPGG